MTRQPAPYQMSHLLNLPYDIRYLIYTHLFPTSEQIYIQAAGTKLACLLPDHRIPTEIFLVCHDLSAEASAFLYNSYLFNIVGTKRDCLRAYESFLVTLKRYAREEVRLDAFSNGRHAATMCVSLQAGEAKVGVLERRRRGEARSIEELEKEELLVSGAFTRAWDRKKIYLTIIAIFAVVFVLGVGAVWGHSIASYLLATLWDVRSNFWAISLWAVMVPAYFLLTVMR